MKRRSVTAVCLACAVLFAGCSLIAEPTWPPEHWDPAEYGSFSPEITVSDDGRYYAVQTLAKPESWKVYGIQVSIYDSETDIAVDSFFTERAMDFWGVCWEPGSYNLWIQSADVGTYCMCFEDGTWVREESGARHMPDGMIDRFRMRNGSFEYGRVNSMDGRLYAEKRAVWDEARGAWMDRIEICDGETDEVLFSQSIDKEDGYRGICWEQNCDILWVRLDDAVYCLRRMDGGWARDDFRPRPESIALAYRWDGTIEK